MDSDQWIGLIDHIRSLYTVDDERISLVGYSLGAMGAWVLAYTHFERFAALAPMSGYANPVWAEHLKNIPIWVFHGAKDDRIPVRESEEMVKVLQANGVDVRFSLDPERKHSPPSDEEHFQLFDWLLAQKRTPAEKLP
jgi:predicted peptidase